MFPCLNDCGKCCNSTDNKDRKCEFNTTALQSGDYHNTNLSNPLPMNIPCHSSVMGILIFFVVFRGSGQHNTLVIDIEVLLQHVSGVQQDVQRNHKRRNSSKMFSLVHSQQCPNLRHNHRMRNVPEEKQKQQ